MSKKNKRKISKIWLVLLAFIWITLFVVVMLYLFNSIKNKKRINDIKGKINIPEGFYYVGGDINNGIVISDSKLDQFKGTEFEKLDKLKGNQFVWVPVEHAIANDFKEAEQLVKEEIFPMAIKDNNNYKALIYKFDTYEKKYIVANQDNYNLEPYILSGDVYGDKEKYIEGSTKNLYQDTFNKMIESVDKNKGFYISRYEIGNISKAVENNEKIVSKSGEEDITYMDWTHLYKISKQMYDREDISTEMIWGCQWDATLIWLAQNLDIRKYVFVSKTVGNYTNNKQKTASSKEYCLNNIYDLAGNAYEWTQRGTSFSGRRAMGGCYSNKNKFYLSDCKDYPITYLWNEVGTRVTMYLN